MNVGRPRRPSTCAAARAGAGLAAAAALARGAPPASQAAPPLEIAYLFRSPSGNVGCWAGTPRGALRAGKPTGGCTFRPEQGYQSVDISRAPVLAYGRSRALPAREVVCRSERPGVTCTNRSGHGFFLSRESIRIFRAPGSLAVSGHRDKRRLPS